MTERESLEILLWDLYKEAHGFRPRGMNMHEMSVQELKDKIAFCEKIVIESIKADEAEWEKCISTFEQEVSSYLKSYPGSNRKEAVDYIVARINGDGSYFDLNDFKINYGLPYYYDVYQEKKC